MKKIIILLVALFAVAIVAAQTAPPLYQQTAKWIIGGEGGWDYLTVDSAANRLYVARGSAYLVIDLDSGQKIGELPASGAHGVAVVADKHLGFSTNGRAGTVTVFDLQSLKPVSEIKVGEGPDAIIYDSHSKQVIVAHGRSKALWVIDPSTLKVTATIPAGGKLEFVAADENHVYVNVEDTGEIAVIDSKSWKLTHRWKLEGCEEPSGLAIDEKLGRLFAVCDNSRMVVVDTKSGALLATLPTGAETDAAAFDPALNYAFASNGEGTLTVVRPAADGQYAVAGSVATARGARTMALDPKTHKIYLATAEFGLKAEGQKRSPILPGTFAILVFSPAR